GGQGGKDLYVSKLESSGWSRPENLGPVINTPHDEVFPYIAENGTLFFSSDGHTGYGGLDVFKTHFENGEWASPENLKSPINSGTDDFGLVFKDEKSGYFSSNRNGGSGDDDIYSFELLKKKPKQTNISGIFMFSKLRAGTNAKINLVDQNNHILQTTTTNEKGEFQFESLDPDMTYLISVDENDTRLTEQSSMFITNSSGEKVMELKKNSARSFTFTALTPEKYDALPLLPEKDQSLLTISLFGQLYEKLPGDYSSGMEVQIVDDGGHILYTSTTDENGNFEFKKLPPDQNYYFRVKNAKSNTNLLILNDKGELIESVKAGKGGVYNYERLDPDETIITLLDEKDAVIKIRPEDNFVISNIYYDYDSWEINEDAAHELDKLVLILLKNPQIGVELSSHTDSRASDDYNIDLSEKRAKAAVEYIVKKGITGKRISGKGYGETQLVNRCANGVDCSEEEHQKNRRTEFKIVKLK
ncbi:MAG: OmpA family protein, partial [Flavobacteriales bacterium]